MVIRIRRENRLSFYNITNLFFPLPSHVSFYGGPGNLSPCLRDGSCEPSYAFYDTLLWNVSGNIALTPAYQLYGDLPALLNSR